MRHYFSIFSILFVLSLAPVAIPAQTDTIANAYSSLIPPAVQELFPSLEKIHLKSGVFRINHPKQKNIWTMRAISLNVQRKSPLLFKLKPAGTFRIPFLREKIIPWTFEFQPGDTLIVQAVARGKNPMRYAHIKDQNKQLLTTCAKCVSIIDTLAFNTPQLFALHLRSAPSFFKQYADVSATVIRPQAPDSSYIVSDTVFQILYTDHSDTLFLTVVDDSLQIDPVWNIEGRRSGCIQLEIPTLLPKGEKLSMIAYWFGIGRNIQDQYITLEKSIPQDWTRPGGQPALTAYLLDKPVSLPPNISNDQVYMAIVPANDRSWVETGQKARKPLWDASVSNNFGRISNKSLAARLAGGKKGFYLPCYACFFNRHTVNGAFITFKLTASYIKTLPQTSQTNIIAIRNNIIAVTK